MNRNIEVINENLWAVNQYYVKVGYIKELKNLPSKKPEKHGISLTNQGILILNTADPVYSITRKLLLRIMEHSDEQLQFAVHEIREVQEPDGYEKMYLNVLEWEIKRRFVKAEYLKSLPKPTYKDKFTKWLRGR